jgi:hypothetical protein
VFKLSFASSNFHVCEFSLYKNDIRHLVKRHLAESQFA